MTDEYIRREAATAYTPLPKHLREYQTGNLDDAFEYGYDYAKDQLEAIPAADVRPVVRGEWRFKEGDGETCSDGWVCSACSCGFHTHVPYFEDFNFCPNCGAVMKGAER